MGEMDSFFEDLSGLNGLEYLQADTAQELKEMIRSIRLPTRILSFVVVGSKHGAWIQTQAKIKKSIPKEKK